MAILAPTSTAGTLGALTMSAACDYDAVIFSVGTTAYTCSFDTSDSNYITKVFGTSPYGSKAMYVYGYYPTDASESIAADVTASKSTGGLDFTTNLSYTYASTPYVISQQVNGTSTNLFKFKTISDGNEVNTSIKIGIYNIREPGTINGTDYGTFSVLVREHDDTDNKPSLLETFNNLSLDPDATNYIARVIGDRYATTDSEGEVAYSGNYPNRSSYIYVDMESIVSNGAISADLIP